MVVDSLAAIDAQLARAAAPKSTNRKPLFLFLKENHKAVVRPLHNLTDVAMMPIHNKWNADVSQKVYAVCAAEIGKECVHCQNAANDKKLLPGISFMLPVFVKTVIDVKTGETITYKEKIDEQEVTKPVGGIRLIELTAFGAASQILTAFRSWMRDSESHDITTRDWTIEQISSGQTKKFPTMPKDASPMPNGAIPNVQTVRLRVLEVAPPAIVGDAAVQAVVQAVKNAQVVADDIPVF